MHKTKLIDFLRTFDKPELKRFGDFVASPFYNKDERLVKLFNHIKKYHPDYDSHMILKERVFKKVFPKVKMRVAYQNKLVHGLLKLAEEFLTQLKFEEKKRMKDLVRLEGLYRNRLEKFFFKEISEKINFYSNQKVIDFESSYTLFQLNRLLYFHNKYDKVSDNKNAFWFYNLHLTWFYLGSVNYSILVTKNFERSIGKKIPLPFTGEMANSPIPQTNLAPQSLINLKTITKLFSEELSHKNYSRLKNIICSDVKLYGNEAKGLLVLLINYVSLLRNKINMSGLYLEKLSLYKMALEKKVLSIPLDIDLINFTNIVKLACKVKDYKWLEKEVVQNLISQNFEGKQSLIKYIQVTLNFVKGEYNQALSKINRNDLENIVPSLRHDLYIIRIKIYFILELSDDFLLSIESYERYIRRHKYYSPQIKKAGLNMAKYFKNLFSIPPFETEKFHSLKEDVENEEYLLNRNWILLKINNYLG